jgi:hypothetical protein
MNPWARHIRGGDVTPSRSGVWAGRHLDGHIARFAFEALNPRNQIEA